MNGIKTTLLMMIVGPIAAMLVQMAISRSREYGADAGGARISGNPAYLPTALKKLHTASQKIPMKANPPTSHVYSKSPEGRRIIKTLQHTSANGGEGLQT